MVLLLKMQLRNIKKNIAQFLAVISIGAIAVTLFVGLQANAVVFENQINTVFTEGNLADLFVTVSSYDQDDDAKINDIVGSYGEVEKRAYIPAKVGNHEAYAVIVDELPKISTAYGNIKTSDKNTDDYFVYLDMNWLDTGIKGTYEYYNLDDTFNLSIDLSSLGLSDIFGKIDTSMFLKEGGHSIVTDGNVNLPMTVTGFMQHPENITKANYNRAVCFISFKMFQEVINKQLSANYTNTAIVLFKAFIRKYMGSCFLDSEKLPYFNQYLIKFNDNNSSSVDKNIRSYFQSKENNNLYLLAKKEEMPFYLTVNADAKQARQFTYVFPFVFFFVAVLVILTTLSQMIIKDRTQIGTLKALGLKRWEIMLNYILLTLILVGIGTLIGEIVGPLLVPNLLGQKYQILYSLPSRKYAFPYLYGFLTALVFLSISALITFLVARKEVKLKAVDSMRPFVPKIKFSNRKSLKSRKTLGLSIRMAFRNLRLDKVKSFMVIFGVLGCTALLVCGFGIEDTIHYGVNHDASVFVNSDITVSLNEYMEKDKLTSKFEGIEGVSYFEPYLRKETTFLNQDGKQTTKVVYVLTTHDSRLGMDVPSDGIAISEKIANTLECKVGDTITLSFNSKLYSIKVSKIFEAFYYNSGVLYYDNSIFDKEISTTNGAFVDVKPGYEINDVASSIKNKLDGANATTQEDFTEQINNTMSGVILMTNAVKVFALLLAVVTLYNLALMNFRQRTRDIATLKVIGFNKREIALSLLIESMSLTFIGVVIGMALGYPFLLAVMKTNVVELVEYLYHINTLSYLYAFLATYFVAFLINLFFVFKSKKIQMVESLKAVD